MPTNNLLFTLGTILATTATYGIYRGYVHRSKINELRQKGIVRILPAHFSGSREY
jgi:hypothetical protein